MKSTFVTRAIAGGVAALACLLISGCGTGTLAPVIVTPPPSCSTSGTTLAGTAFTGKVMAGAQAMSGATVQLYAAGNTGKASAPTSILNSALTTDSTGAFSVPAGYTCPLSSSSLYLVARGGKAGTPGTSNSASVMMAALGSCSAVTTKTIVVNEVTTAAAVWSLAQFMGTGATVGGSCTNTVGIANAFATATNLADDHLGTAPGATFPANGTLPISKINTLANLLNTCTASTGASGAGSACGTLFAQATVGGSVPANTLDAALNIVKNPALNVGPLFSAAAASSAFQPALTTLPNDSTMYAAFTGGGMHSPSGLGVDSQGNVWVASYFSVASKFTPTGVPVFAAGITANGLNESYGLAMDAADDPWIPNEQTSFAVNSGNGSVTVLNSNGQSISGPSGFAAGGLNYPIAVAIDTDASAWVVDYGNSHLTKLSGTGAPLSGALGFTTPLFAFPVAVAVDGNHNAWIANQSSSNVTKVSADGSTFINYACCNGSTGIGIDQSNNVWIANYYGNSVSLISSTGTIVSNGYKGVGGIAFPQGVAIDGAGTAWVTNFRGPSLTELAGASTSTPGAALSPAAGWAPEAALLEAYAIAIDASGNLWISNFGNDSITEFVGIAVPVKAPRVGLPQTP